MTNSDRTNDLAETYPNDTWTSFDRYFDELGRHLDAAFGGGPRAPGSALVWRAPRASAIRAARTDVVDTGAAFTVTLEVPGVPKEKLEVRVTGTNVEVKSREESATEEKAPAFLHRERVFRGVYRAVELPEPVVAEKVTARLADGVLVLELPKLRPTPETAEVVVPVQ